MGYIDKTGQGHTLLILTDAESRLLRGALTAYSTVGGGRQPLEAFNRGIQRGTEKMSEESKADWKSRTKVKP